MAGKKTENEKLAPIIIKRVKKVAGGHHGGAWKVAYADFVTAMMAFFLLMWLLNVTTDEQKNAISNYFDPTHPIVSDSSSGAGGLLGGLSVSPDGAMVSTVQPITQPQVPDTSTRGNLHGADKPGETEGLDADGGFYNTLDMTEQQMEAELRKREDARFEAAAEKLREDIAAAPELQDLQGNILVDITPEGLRIQIVDDQGRSMFPSGSAVMRDFMRGLLLKVAGVVAPLPNQVSVRGHTDSVRYRDPARYDNWNLSADRAQSSRRVLTEGGLTEKRIENVIGRSDRDHLLPDDPANARNRRISIVLLRERLTLPKRTTEAPAATTPAQPGLRIVDDTQQMPAQTQDGTAAQTQASPDAATAGQDNTAAPALPVRPREQTIQRQPQTSTFGGTQATPDNGDAPAPVAGGGARSGGSTGSNTGGNAGASTGGTYVNKPPTIQTPVFNFGKKAEPAPAPEPATEEPQVTPRTESPASTVRPADTQRRMLTF